MPYRKVPEDILDPFRSSRLRVRKRWYFVHFLLLFLLLNLLDLGVQKETDYGLQRVERLYNGKGSHTIRGRDQRNVNELSQILDATPADIENAEYVVERFIRNLRDERVIDWNNLIRYRYGDYEFYLGLDILRNLLFASLFAGFLYWNRRSALSLELIEYQNKQLQKINKQFERKMQESESIIEKLNKLQAKLVEAEKLASIGRLSATLAHEIRNPLTIIKSATDILDDSTTNKHTIASVGLIREEVDRLDRIITDLLEFARPKPARIEAHNIKQLVRHWLPPIVEELEKHQIRLIPELEERSLEVAVDADQLYQVFLNVMWNARDAIGGMPDAKVTVGLERGTDDFCFLSIQDNGPGMLPEIAAQIKEPFFTTKTQGTGLGLPVSVQLMEAMGGGLDITSELEVGTIVTLTLPLAKTAVGDSSDGISSDVI